MLELASTAPAPDDDALWRRFVEHGDSQAFERIFTRYAPKVFRWCERVLGDGPAAEDATQAIFLDLLERPDRYDPRQRFGAWLYVVARNHCRNALRGGKREKTELSEEIIDSLVVEDSQLRDMERGELSREIREICAERLDAREQEVIYLRYHWEMQVAEITQLMGLRNASGARTHLRSAEAKLRRYLKRFHQEGRES